MSRSSLHRYAEVQKSNLSAAFDFELFASTCPPLADLYEAITQSDFTGLPDNRRTLVLKQILLVCQKSFVSAAILVGQAQPDDAAMVTRRAIEAVRLAAAIKSDEKVLDDWRSYQRRLERWQARSTGNKPRRFHFNIKVTDPRVEQLMCTWGFLSDVYGHFTPEHLIGALTWEQRDGEMFLHFFAQPRAVEVAILNLVGTHLIILDILNDCFDGALSRRNGWSDAIERIRTSGKTVADGLEVGRSTF